MADYEVSKLMWMAIVIALAASIFVIAKPEIQTQAAGVFDKVGAVVQGINLDGDTPPADVKYIVTGAEGAGTGDFKLDISDGNGTVIGHYVYDSSTKVGKIAFDVDAAKDVDLTNGINAMLPNSQLGMQGQPSAEIKNILSVDKDGQKTSNSATFSVMQGQQLQISGNGEHQSIYGVVIEVVGQEDAASGSTINSFSRTDVTSHYEEVK